MIVETKATILCALCGIKFIPSAGSICPTCTIKSLEQQQVLQGDDINYCRYCMRFERPPWINCERESQEMMAILLKKVKGLNKVELQSASFVWTEPHSKRLKLKIVFLREVGQNMKIESTQLVEFIEKYSQCNDCRKKFTPHDWVALVQVRQHASHKKTVLNLEQVLLKEKLAQRIIKTEEAQGGVDFYFSTENDAIRLVDFLKSRYPTLTKLSEKYISSNERDNTANIKITHSCVIPKICKDDLVKIPRKLSKQLGSCCEALLCTKVSSYLHFLDISSFKKIQITATQYFLYEPEIEIYTLKTYARKFVVLDSELKERDTPNKYDTFGLTFMKQDEYVERYMKSHIADEPGNELLGFDLTQIENFEGVKNLPDYLMVQKIKDKESKKKNKSKRRKRDAETRRMMSETASKQQNDEDFGDDFDEDSDDEWEDIEEVQQPIKQPQQVPKQPEATQEISQ